MSKTIQQQDQQQAPWNKGRLIGQKRPLKPKEVWNIRARLQRRPPTVTPHLSRSTANPENADFGGTRRTGKNDPMRPVADRRANITCGAKNGR